MSADKKIGRFRLDHRLCRNSMGRWVYLGIDDDRMHQASIEVLDKQASAERGQAFLTEALSLAKLHHPHIVPIFDVGRTEEGEYYLVSKFIDGIELRQRVQKECLTCDESVRLTATIAQTLHFIHQRGLIHGNLNLGNILIENKTGTPFVTNFFNPLRTRDGIEDMIFGNPSYCSPEQVRGEIELLDGRSDIFSLGSIFYELLTGRRPFRGDSLDVIDQISSVDPVSPRKLNGAIPVELERICLKALAKGTSQRYSTGAEMADALLHWHTRSTWWWLPKFRRS